MKQGNLVRQLVSFCLEQTAKGNHFFFDYAAHVNTFSMRGYIGEWALYKEPIQQSYSFSVDKLTQEKVNNCIATFISIINN